MLYHQRSLYIAIKFVFIEGNMKEMPPCIILYFPVNIVLRRGESELCSSLGWKVTLKSEMRNITVKRKVPPKQTEIAIQTYVARKFGLSAN